MSKLKKQLLAFDKLEPIYVLAIDKNKQSLEIIPLPFNLKNKKGYIRDLIQLSQNTETPIYQIIELGYKVLEDAPCRLNFFGFYAWYECMIYFNIASHSFFAITEGEEQAHKLAEYDLNQDVFLVTHKQMEEIGKNRGLGKNEITLGDIYLEGSFLKNPKLLL